MNDLQKNRWDVAHTLIEYADRIATSWLHICRFTWPDRDWPWLIDGLVEPFVVAIGHRLSNKPGEPWTKTAGVLRLSPRRGEKPLCDEFGVLRRCLHDACDVLDGDRRDRQLIDRAIAQGLHSALTLQAQLSTPRLPGPVVPFGGIVIELFERKPFSKQQPPHFQWASAQECPTPTSTLSGTFQDAMEHMCC
jgi:hypothetical protein